MRFWLAKNGEVPIKQQLATQIMLAIVSGDLKVNQKMPSSRELARRLNVHYNTVTSTYRDLARRGWLELHPGSNFYVRERAFDDTNQDKQLKLDYLIVSFLKELNSQGFTLSDLEERLPRWLEMQPPRYFLVIDPCKELRKILSFEINSACNFPVKDASPEECNKLLNGSIPVGLYGRLDKSKAKLPANLRLLTSNSLQEGLHKYPKIPSNISLVIISYWSEFLSFGKTMLNAIGLDLANLSFRDANQKDWKIGIRKAKVFVVTDALTAKELPSDCHHLVFNIVSNQSLDELKQLLLI